MSRKTITKKLRFDVFKRDAFQCVYCGETPPKVTLEIDHIEPVSKGGTNDINNLVTACFDCNRGKGKTRLSSIPNQIGENLELLKEREKQLKEYNNFLNRIKRRKIKTIDKIELLFFKHYFFFFSKSFKAESMMRFVDLLPTAELEDAFHVVKNKFPNDKRPPEHEDIENLMRYFCGICWRKIKANE